VVLTGSLVRQPHPRQAAACDLLVESWHASGPDVPHRTRRRAAVL